MKKREILAIQTPIVNSYQIKKTSETVHLQNTSGPMTPQQISHFYFTKKSFALNFLFIYLYIIRNMKIYESL